MLPFLPDLSFYLAGGQVQEVPLGNHHQGGAAEAHCKAPHRQYEMVVKYQNCENGMSELLPLNCHKKGTNYKRLQGL